jgi:hypothetical protein
MVHSEYRCRACRRVDILLAHRAALGLCSCLALSLRPRGSRHRPHLVFSVGIEGLAHRRHLHRIGNACRGRCTARRSRGRAAGRRKEQSDARRTPRTCIRLPSTDAAPDLPRGAGDGVCVELSDRSTNRRYGRIRCRDRSRLVQWALSVTCPGSAPDDAPSSHTIGLSSDRRGQSRQGNARAGSDPGSSPAAHLMA